MPSAQQPQLHDLAVQFLGRTLVAWMLGTGLPLTQHLGLVENSAHMCKEI